MTTSTFEFHTPTSVAEALELLSSHGDGAKLLAGGHSLVPIMKLRLAEPEVLIDLSKIDGLSGVTEADGGLSIGPMTTYYELMTSDLVNAEAPVLAEAAGLVADVQVRNRGTIGGSVAHADPAGDLPGVLLALGARFEATSAGGTRTIESDDMFVDLLATALEPNEILTGIFVPATPAAAYEKFANKASRYAIVGVCAVLTVLGGRCTAARIGVTGAGPTATRATGSEAALVGRSLDADSIKAAASVAADGIDALSDVHASDEYRVHLTMVAAKRAIIAAAERAG
jgi:aerobic carbon-monoxide dehydrogenase medium subunit